MAEQMPKRHSTFDISLFVFIRVHPWFNLGMGLFEKLKALLGGKVQPEHLRRGVLGERAARKF